MPVVINILLAIHVIVSLLIVLIVLMQRPKNEGLGAAFGGGMTDNLFGAQTTNVLQTITRWLGGIFFLLTLLLSILYVKQASTRSGVQKVLSDAPAVVPATPVPGPTAASDPVHVTDTPSTAAVTVPATTAPAIDAKVPAESKAPAPAAPAPADASKPAAPAPTPAAPPVEAAKSADAPAPAPAPTEPAKPQN